MSAAVTMPATAMPLACADSVVIVPLDKRTPSRALNFVRSTWTVNFGASMATRRLPLMRDSFAPLHQRYVDRLLARPSVSVLIAHPVRDAELVCGWLCAERVGGETALHYVYVAGTFRRWGIASALARRLGEGPVICTTWPPPRPESEAPASPSAAQAIVGSGKLPRSWVSDPFWIPKEES